MISPSRRISRNPLDTSIFFINSLLLPANAISNVGGKFYNHKMLMLCAYKIIIIWKQEAMLKVLLESCLEIMTISDQICTVSSPHHNYDSGCEVTAISIPPTWNCSAIISGMRSTECPSSWVESSLNWPGYEMLMLMLRLCWRVDQQLLLKCATFVWAQLSQIQPVNISFAIS